MENEDNANNNIKKRTKLTEWIKGAIANLPEMAKKAPRCIWKKLKESLFYAVLKACLLILILIYVIFIIKPSRAHVSVNISELKDNEASLSADLITLSSSDCEKIVTYSDEVIDFKLMPNSSIVEKSPHEDYKKATRLVFYPGEDNACGFVISGRISGVSFENASSESMRHFFSDAFGCTFVGPQRLSILLGKAVLVSDNGEIVSELKDLTYNIIRENQTGRVVLETNNGDIVAEFHALFPNELGVYTDDEQLILGFGVENNTKKSKEETVPVVEQPYVIHASKNNVVFNLDHRDIREDEKPPINTYVKFHSSSLLADGAYDFESIVTGNLALSYSPTPKEYVLYKQELKLKNETKPISEFTVDLNVEYNEEDEPLKTDGVIYGYVSDGEVSKISLFPSFKTWFYSNAYMTPTAIITIVLTAIALFRIKKD